MLSHPNTRLHGHVTICDSRQARDRRPRRRGTGGNAMLIPFYQTAAQLCFTLLGLWWLVLQTKYGEWNVIPARRRLATSISLYFLLPGAMSLIALLGSNVPTLWRVSFGIASGLGALATAPVWTERRSARGVRKPVVSLGILAVASLVGRWLGVLLFAGMLVVSVIPQLAQVFQTPPLFLAGIALALLVTLGVGLAWTFFLESPLIDG